MNFIDAIIAGEAKPEDVDDWVEAWHVAPEDGVELHDYLGMTWNEYGDWVREPDMINAIVLIRRAQRAAGS